MSYNIFCDPSGGTCAQTVRNDFDGTGYNSGSIFGCCSAVLGGIPAAAPTNVNCADLSVILMGDSNVINIFSVGPPVDNGIYNFMGNGCQNMAAGCFVNIFNGDTNNVCGYFSSVVNGQNNCIGGGVAGCCPACFSFIGGGSGNCICTDGTTPSIYSFIGGGQNNTIAVGGNYSVIAGGCDNNAGGLNSFIGSGARNVAEGSYIAGGICNCSEGGSFIGGGYLNCIYIVMPPPLSPAMPTYSAIAGGGGNLICAFGSMIGSGYNNCINTFAYPCPSSEYSFIGGGLNNCSVSIGSFIGSGDTNFILSTICPVLCASIVGGAGNAISDNGTNTADLSFIGGGSVNNIFSVGSAIVGGQNHNVCSQFSFIGGGDTNVINVLSDCSFIGGGNLNNVGAGVNGSIFSAIGGGYNNCVDDTNFASQYSSILGGSNHCVNGNNLFVGGGDTNYICSTGGFGPVLCSAIVGGVNNVISDDGVSVPSNLSFIGGGNANQICSVGSVIGGGRQNCISGNIHETMGFAFIGGGCRNCTSSPFSFIGGGRQNSIFATGGVIGGVIVGGDGNIICESPGAYIGNGETNFIDAGSPFSFIGGGQNNSLGLLGGLGASCSVIVGGCGNIIDDTGAATSYGVIGGGLNNFICAGTNNASIFSGEFNLVSGSCSSIVSGSCNCVTGAASFIGGGGGYDPVSGTSFGNCIGLFGGAGSFGSFIGGGQNNVIDDTGAATSFGIIGGGQCNYIAPGTNHSSIFSGCQNSVGGSCSSILGGSGNSDGGFPYVGVFGENVTGVAPNTFHVECLNAINTPIYPGVGTPYAPGTIFAYNGATPPAGAYLLYIQL